MGEGAAPLVTVEPGESCDQPPGRAVRWMVAALVVLAPFFIFVINYVPLLVGYRLLLPVWPALFDHAGAGEVSGWAWRIALWCVPLMMLQLTVFSGRRLWRAFKTRRFPQAPAEGRLTRVLARTWEPLAVFVAAMLVLPGEPDSTRVYVLTAISVLLAGWLNLLKPFYRHVLRPTSRALRAIGRPIGRALRRFDRWMNEGVAEVRTCKTGYHHRWCGHLEDAD